MFNVREDRPTFAEHHCSIQIAQTISLEVRFKSRIAPTSFLVCDCYGRVRRAKLLKGSWTFKNLGNCLASSRA